MQVKQVKQLKRMKTRTESDSVMHKVGWLATGLVGLGLLAMLGLVVSSLPELRRYVKMETM